MELESLPNELLLDLFDYIGLGQILRSFQSLNSRFDQLIFFYQKATRHLDFRFISKRNFYIFYESQIINRIISLTVSGDDGTPLLIELFQSDDYRVHQFINLQSLSLYHIHSPEIMKNIVSQLDLLPHLTHINLIDCCFASHHVSNYSGLNKIWNMPKLVHLYISTTPCKNVESFWPSVISPSLKYLSIQNFSGRKYSLYDLFQCISHLRCLQIYSKLTREDSIIPLLPRLVKFELNERCTSDFLESIGTKEIENILEKMPNLSHLSIESSCMFLDGYSWENIIKNYLSKLKVFRCKCRIKIYFNNFDEIERRVNNLLQSFQSDFWLQRFQLFIRCHWKSESKDKHNILYYTLPYIFSHPITITDYLGSKSTCPSHNDYWPSDSVHNLQYNFSSPIKLASVTEGKSSKTSFTFCERICELFRWNSDQTESVSFSQVENELRKICLLSSTCVIPRFTTIRELSVTLPVDKYFSYFIPKLDQLISLNVELSTDFTDSSDLQELIDQAPNLYSLSIIYSATSTSTILLGNIRSTSIHKLNLREISLFDHRNYYNIQQCIELSCSPLGKQCEILNIGVQERKCILYLIKEMTNLRLLNVNCFDFDYGNNSTLSSGIFCMDIEQWLKDSLPSTIKIGRYYCCENIFMLTLWIS